MIKTYTTTLFAKLRNSLSTILYLLIGFGLFAGLGVFRDPIKWARQIQYGDKETVWIIFLFLFLLFLGFVTVRSMSASVTIGPAALTFTPASLWFPSRRDALQGTIQFVNITKVAYGRISRTLHVHSRTHATRILQLWMFDGEKEILEHLRIQVGDRFVSQKSVDVFWLTQFIFTWVYAIYLFSLGLVQPFGYSFVWTPVLESSPLMDVDTQAFSLDEDGKSVWIVDGRVSEDEWKVWKVNDQSIQVWKDLESSFPNMQISHDVKGNPVVIKEKEIDRWQNGDWKVETFGYLDLSYSRLEHPIVFGSQYWQSYLSFVVKRDFVNGELKIPPPTSLPGASIYGFRINFDGSLLVDVGSSGDVETESDVYLYLLQDNEWVEPGYYLGRIYRYTRADLIDYSLDAEGKPWVLREIEEDNQWVYQVGYYSSAENRWIWIPLSPHSLQRERYYALQVDQRGRLWLEGDIYNDFFVRVYEVASNDLHEIVEYNEQNSDLPTDIPITLGPDGKMWVAGDTVSFIDSSAPVLPKPLPKWLAWLGTTPGMYTILVFMVVALILIIASRPNMAKSK